MNRPEPTAADCKAALAKHGMQSAAARALGMDRVTFKRRLGGTPPARRAVKSAPASTTQARSLSEFRATFDKDTIFPQRIDAALQQLGKDGWAYEVEFAKLATLGLSQLAVYREAYAEYVVHLGRDSKRAWAGSKGLAAKMREML